jgi:hypothetical protein
MSRRSCLKKPFGISPHWANRPATFRHALYSLMGDVVLSRQASTSSGHGTIVDFTVFIAIASATARDTPSSVNG